MALITSSSRDIKNKKMPDKLSLKVMVLIATSNHAEWVEYMNNTHIPIVINNGYATYAKIFPTTPSKDWPDEDLNNRIAQKLILDFTTTEERDKYIKEQLPILDALYYQMSWNVQTKTSTVFEGPF